MTLPIHARFSLFCLRRLTALALMATMIIATAPATLAANGIKDAAGSLMTAVEVARTRATRLAAEVRQLNAGPNGQNRGMPPAPVNPAPVTPERTRSKAEREARASQIKLNTSQDVQLQSRERISFSGIPLDYLGTPIHGLHVDWDSSNRQVVQVRKDGEAIAGKPGSAILTAGAGGVRQTVRVTVSRGDLDQFGGRKRTAGAKPKGQTRNKSSQPKATARLTKSARRNQNHIGTTASLNATLVKAGTLVMPQDPEANPLADEETSSLYLTANSVGALPGKTVRGARVHTAATDGTENPGSTSFSFGIPVFGLSGRGIDAALELVHNSQLFNKFTDGSSTEMTYNVDSGWPAPGWRLGFGQMEYQGGPFTLTDADGTRHGLNCSGYDCATNDGTFLLYTGTSGSGILYYPDGTEVTYGAGGGGLRIYPTKITDANGNYFLISYVSGVGPKISSIEDTLQRYVNFYYASNGDLVTIRAPGINGQDRVVMRLYYDTVNVTTSGLFQSGITVTAPSTAHVIKYIYLPSSVEASDAHIGYTFDYTSYGMMYQTTKYHGMSASWSSNTDVGSNPSVGTSAAVTLYSYEGSPGRSIPTGGLSETPDYTERSDDWAGRVSAQPVYQFSVNKSTGVSTVTAPDGSINETDTIVDAGQWDDGLVSDLYVDKQSSTVFLSHTKLTWDSTSTINPRIAKSTTTDDGNNSKATVLTYTSYNNVSVVSECAFTSDPANVGSELRRTEITYESSTNYINRHLLHLPLTVKVFPGTTQTAASRVEYAYDNYGASHADLTHRDDIVMHDPAFDPFQQTVETDCHWQCNEWDGHTCIDSEWVCTETNPYVYTTDYRGNVTSVTTYADAGGGTGAITHGTKYDIAGNVTSAEVDCCQQKVFTYSGAGSGGNHDYAYPISVTSGSSSTTLTTSATFDYSSGLLATSTDANSRVTTYSYDSDSLRTGTIQRPDGSTTTYYYGSALQGNSGTNGLHYFINTGTKLDATRYVDSYRWYDGRGAVTQTYDNYAYDSQLQTPSSNWSTQDIEYDVMGRAYRGSNPYYSGGYGWRAVNPDGFWTAKAFDHLGRVTQVTMPRGEDNNSLTTSVHATYVGVITDVSDQAGKLRRQKTDEFGRVVRLDEPNSSNQLDVSGAPYQSTSYEYDTLNNLTHITQGAQDRYFKYDSLNRLLYERQPEQSAPHTTSYGVGNDSWSRKNTYDSHGLLTDSFDVRRRLRRT